MERSRRAASIWNAVVKNMAKELKQALEQGQVSPNEPITPLGLNLLLASISEEKNEIIKIVLEHPNTNLEAVDMLGRTAMHYAAANGNIEAIKQLLDKGAQINSHNNAGETPLMKACQFIEIDAIEFMLTIPGINISAEDVSKKTAHDILKNMVNMEQEEVSQGEKISLILDKIDSRMKQEN